MVGTLPVNCEATSPSQIVSGDPIVLSVTTEQLQLTVCNPEFTEHEVPTKRT